MNQDEDHRVAFDAACILIAHGHGKPRERVVHEQQDIVTVQTVRYETLEEARAKLIEAVIPLDRLGQPRLIEHEPSDDQSSGPAQSG